MPRPWMQRFAVLGAPALLVLSLGCGSSETAVSAPGACEPRDSILNTFLICNKGVTAITGIYVVRPDFQAWNENLIPDHPIPPDSGRAIGPFDVSPSWDLKATFANGTVFYDCQVPLSSNTQPKLVLPGDATSAECPLGDPRFGSVIIYNRGSSALAGVWILPSFAIGPWPSDQLLREVKTNEYWVTTNVKPEDSPYDVKVWLQTGETLFACGVSIAAGRESVLNLPTNFLDPALAPPSCAVKPGPQPKSPH